MDARAELMRRGRNQGATASSRTARSVGSLVVIVNLVRRGNPLQRSVETSSRNEPENALVQIAVFGNELPLHETHVGLKRQRVAELRARADPLTQFSPTNPLKSVICDGSLRASSAVAVGSAGKWWMKMPSGDTPPGIGLGAALLPFP